MKISEKVYNLLEKGWAIHENSETVMGGNGGEVQIPTGLRPGQVCREVDGIFLVYVGETDE